MRWIKKIISVLLLVVMSASLAGCKDSDSIKTINAKLKSPCDMKVTSHYGSIFVVPYGYNFSYAINEKEWCSAVADSKHPIDMSYNQALFVTNTSTCKLTFNFPVNPDKLIYIRRYDASLLNSDFEEEDKSLGESIERRGQYEEYSELELPDDMKFPFSIVVGNDKDYIYEVAAIWDREEYRGTGYYSFLVRKRDKNAGK